MILRNSDLQSVSDLDSIRNSCDVSFKSSHIYFEILYSIRFKQKGGGGHPPTHHSPQGRILTTFRLFLLQGADNEGGFWLISVFFLLQGAGD